MRAVITVGKLDILPLLDGSTLPRCGVVCTPVLSSLHAEEAVLIVGDGAVLPDRLCVMAAVVDSDSGFRQHRLNGTPVITCGLGSRNTISITSKTAEYVTLSLNRSIHTLNGLCEPLELPMPVLDGMEDYGYMAAFAASILLGNIG